MAVLLACALPAGCSGIGTEGSTGGYVSGSKFVTFVEPEDRDPAPVLEGEDLEGEDRSSEEFDGEVLVVNVWGSWCPPCRAEAPVLNQISEQYTDDGVQFLGLVVRDNPDAARAFERKFQTPYPSILDGGGRLQLGFADTLPSQAIPTTWVIDADGNVAARIVDPELRASTLAGVIDDVLASVDG
ncbi:TlpA family protein disulfide reductase [Aeromicrobium sp. CTD01-1L150]|uniref:TlpA family protein disulfide reductase n=1 Tax=Aeromicrobium sp. CTD01-1L150 TaxID=3341830 RepID=UPI0035C096AA